MGVGLASAQFETNITYTVNQPIPDANVNGLSLSANLGGFGGNSIISNVKLSLNITGEALQRRPVCVPGWGRTAALPCY